jgi:hypothetical protein
MHYARCSSKITNLTIIGCPKPLSWTSCIGTYVRLSTLSIGPGMKRETFQA